MLDRIMGVVSLKAPIYRQIADDQAATTQAAIIVVIATLIQGFFQGLVLINAQTGVISTSMMRGIVMAVLGVILGLIGWVISAWVLQFVANALGGKTNIGEMLRVTGFVEVFGIVAVLNILVLFSSALVCIAGLIGFVVGILKLIGYVIGVREAGEFSTGNAVITAIVAAIVNFIIVGGISGVVMGILAITS